MDECTEEEKNKLKQERKDDTPPFTSSQEFNDVIHQNEKISTQGSFEKE